MSKYTNLLSLIKRVTFSQNPSEFKGEIENALAEIITEKAPSSAPPYKRYAAKLTQIGTNPPTAYILENTLGVTPIFQRVMPGEYIMVAANKFPALKTVLPIGSNATLMTVTDDGYPYNFVRTSDNTITIQAHNGDGTLTNAYIEVVVYN